MQRSQVQPWILLGKLTVLPHLLYGWEGGRLHSLVFLASNTLIWY